MKHILRKTGELCRHKDGDTVPVYTYDEWYIYNVHEGDTVVITDGSTSSMYILKGDRKCEECPIRTDTGVCALAVKCRATGGLKTVCRAELGVHSIEEIMENL